MNHKALPSGWSTAPIGMLCSLENGRAFKSIDWSSKGIPIVRIQNLNNPNAPFNYFDQEYSDRYHLNGGELLFAWSGTPGTSFGAHIWHGKDAVLNQHIFRVDFDEKSIDKRFFRYAINQKLGELIDVAHGGVGLRHVTKGKFEKTEVIIPPLNEQKRIADKLDALLARVDACRERLDRLPQILKRFRQAVLTAATSGTLTEEWRNTDSLEWRHVCLADIADIQGGVTKDSKKQQATDEEVPYLRVANVQRGYLDLNEIKTIRIPSSKLHRFCSNLAIFFLMKAAILTNLVGGGFGRDKSQDAHSRITFFERVLSASQINRNTYHGGAIHVALNTFSAKVNKLPTSLR